MYKILICDDDLDIVNALKIYLADDEYQFLEAYNGLEALEIVESQDVHLVLMDIMMPCMDGISALSKIRAISNVPIIMLTAKSEDTDKILGLNLGADDYITKPFKPMEVVARVKSQLRRYLHLGSGIVKEGAIVVGNIELDDSRKVVFKDGEPVSLTPTEFDILKFLMVHKNKVFSPKDIYNSIWNEEVFTNDNTIAVHIRHIREKIEINPAEPRYLKVVWGHGYMMED